MKYFSILILVLVAITGVAQAEILKSWEYENSGNVTAMRCFSSRAFVAYDNGELVALSIKSGSVIWKQNLPGQGIVKISVNGGDLFTLRGDALTKLDCATGKVQQTVTAPFPLEDVILAPSPVNGRLIVQAQGKTYLVDPIKGKVLHIIHAPFFYDDPRALTVSGRWMDSFWTSENLGFFAMGKTLLAINLKTGKKVWSVRAPFALYNAPAFFKKKVFATGPKGVFVVKAKDGTMAWEHEIPHIKIESPNLFFVAKRKRFLCLAKDGLVIHSSEKPETLYHYPLPDPARLLFAENRDIYFLFTFKPKKTDTWRSMLFRHNMRVMQLYGRSDVAGKASGFFARWGNNIFVELSEGKLYELDKNECEVHGELPLSEKPLLFMESVGNQGVVATAEGKILGLIFK